MERLLAYVDTRPVSCSERKRDGAGDGEPSGGEEGTTGAEGGGNRVVGGGRVREQGSYADTQKRH